VIGKDQHAFRKGGSTSNALTEMVYKVGQRLECCQYVRLLLVDFSKAFDMIDHCHEL
jgi:hypothetical protein